MTPMHPCSTPLLRLQQHIHMCQPAPCWHSRLAFCTGQLLAVYCCLLCGTEGADAYLTCIGTNTYISVAAGYNTLETTKEPILEHIRKQSAIYLTDEHEIQRNNPGGKLDDSRVDVALFFIAPHRLRPLDIEFITDLAELVPVVGGCILRFTSFTNCPSPGSSGERLQKLMWTAW